jgi:hypothetical protein
MPIPILLGIVLVPVKAGTILQRIRSRHTTSIRPSYTDLPEPEPPNRAKLAWLRSRGDGKPGRNFGSLNLRIGSRPASNR